MMAVSLDPETEERLQKLASDSGQSQVEFVREAILRHIEDLEDVRVAESRINSMGQLYTEQEVKDELGLSD